MRRADSLEKNLMLGKIEDWRIPGTGEPGGLLSMGSHRVGHDWSGLAAAAAVYKDTQTPYLPGFSKQ